MPTLRFSVYTLALAALGASARSLPAQTPTPERTEASSTPAARASWRLTLTIFRSPGTGLQLARGPLAVFVAHYPTIFLRDGEQRTTHFVRLGVARYLRPDAATSPYVSVSVAPSLTRGWTTSGLLDVGVRRRLVSSLSGQLGVAALYAPAKRATRVNPTIGLGVAF